MYEDRKIRVAITHGDTNGIGYEINPSIAAQAIVSLEAENVHHLDMETATDNSS